MKTLLPCATLALLLLGLCLRSLEMSARHAYPSYDETAVLDLARGFHALGGLRGALQGYLSGSCREDNIHPLYPLTLLSFLDGTPGDFSLAKLASLLNACLLVLAGYLLSRPLWGRSVALAVSAAAALSPVLVAYSQNSVPDSLFSLLYLSSVLVLCAKEFSSRSWLCFGVLAAGAYLAKGNGHLLLLSAFAVALHRRGRCVLLHKDLYLAGGAFAATAGFLLWRNILVWKDPFHHLGTRIIWLERADQYPRAMAWPSWEQVGPLQYLQNTSPLSAISGFFLGLRDAAVRLAETMAVGPAGPAPWLIGLLLLGTALHGLRLRWRQGHRHEVWAVAPVGLATFLALAWQAKGHGAYTRHFLPVGLSLLPMAALGIRDMVMRLRFSPERAAAALRSAVLVSALLSAAGAAGGLRRDPRRLWSLPPFWTLTSDWIRRNVDAAGFLNDGWSPYSNWDAPPNLRRGYPYNVPRKELEEFALRRGLRFAVVDLSITPFDAYPEKYGPVDDVGPTSFLGWPRCYRAPVEPNPLLVYAVSCPLSRSAPK